MCVPEPVCNGQSPLNIIKEKRDSGADWKCREQCCILSAFAEDPSNTHASEKDTIREQSVENRTGKFVFLVSGARAC